MAVVKKAGSERVEQYLRRISGTICGRHWHGNRGQISRKLTKTVAGSPREPASKIHKKHIKCNGISISEISIGTWMLFAKPEKEK